MTGPEHYVRAEQLTATAEDETERPDSWRLLMLSAAQAHATLALAAATALQVPGGEDAGMYIADVEQWETAASAQIRDEQED